MPKISQYPDAGVVYASDQFVIARAGSSKSVLGSSVGSGWVSVPGSWTYASSNTINIPSDGTLIYQKGDFIRWKQGGAYKYAVAQSVAATLLTLIPSADYSVANAPITDIGYCHGGNPYGWPGQFNWTPTLVGFSADPPNAIYRYRTYQNRIELSIVQPTNGTSNAANFTISLPVAAQTMTNYQVVGVGGFVVNNGVPVNGGAVYIQSAATTMLVYTDQIGTLWATSNGKRISAITITYVW